MELEDQDSRPASATEQVQGHTHLLETLTQKKLGNLNEMFLLNNTAQRNQSRVGLSYPQGVTNRTYRGERERSREENEKH